MATTITQLASNVDRIALIKRKYENLILDETRDLQQNVNTYIKRLNKMFATGRSQWFRANIKKDESILKNVNYEYVYEATISEEYCYFTNESERTETYRMSASNEGSNGFILFDRSYSFHGMFSLCTKVIHSFEIKSIDENNDEIEIEFAFVKLGIHGTLTNDRNYITLKISYSKLNQYLSKA